jgi:ABC-type transport system substrate-binding protein
LYLIYDRLINFDQKTGELKPGLATKWGFVGDKATTFELTIRDGVKFQDGTPVDADAVVASLDRFRKLGVSSDLVPVESVSTSGPGVVKIELTKPYSALPAVLADRAGMVVSPAAVEKWGQDFASHPVGAGPYAVESQVSGSKIEFGASKNYWQGEPNYKTIDWKIFADATAMLSAARSGQADVTLQVPPNDAKSLTGNANFDVVEGPSLAFSALFLTTSLKPFDSPKVREAFAIAMNRDDMLTAINGGTGEAAWQIVPKDSPYHNPDIDPTYEFDTARAKSLLTEAGYPDGIDISCMLIPVNVDAIAEIVQAQAAKVGIRMKIIKRSLAEGLEAFTKGTTPCGFSNWTGRPDPAMSLSLLYGSKGSYNYGHRDFGVDGMLDELNATTDPAQRIESVKKISAAASAETPIIPLIFGPSVSLVSKKVTGFENSFQGKPDITTVKPK